LAFCAEIDSVPYSVVELELRPFRFADMADRFGLGKDVRQFLLARFTASGLYSKVLRGFGEGDSPGRRQFQCHLALQDTSVKESW
jgi:hypothetical protein